MLVITVSLAMTIGAWQFSRAQLEAQVESRFEAAKKRTIDLITDRMERYEDALLAGVATINAHGGMITREQWRKFVSSLEVTEKYPGIGGVSVVRYLQPEELPGYLEAERLERPDFKVHPQHDQPAHSVITYFEPEAPNAAALGLDILFEQNRRAGAFKARDSGRAQISGPIHLVQEKGYPAGFLFYTPFYKGTKPTTTEARREQIDGFVMAPFVVRKLMQGVLAADRRLIRFNIRDGGELIHDELLRDGSLADPDPMFHETVSLELYGRVWEIEMESNLAFRDSNTYAQPTFILIGGLLIEVLIIWLLTMMARSNRRAVAYADSVTADLKDKSAKLATANNGLEQTNAEIARSNAELQQFAYVTSHDLRTPIRGIGSLTEMVVEDLEPYFASPDAEPEVRENLERIQERVARMNDLTSGIMEYSRVNAPPVEDVVLSLSESVETMRTDFDLAGDQLTLTSDTECIHDDTFNFRRVIENLVSNAIKYHAGPVPLRIAISVQQMDDRIMVAVADNGPGIDPQYHERIFDLFQTLRLDGQPESTGVGLSIVKKAVERNRGSVDVSATPGGGATFRFDWPHTTGKTLQTSMNEAA